MKKLAYIPTKVEDELPVEISSNYIVVITDEYDVIPETKLCEASYTSDYTDNSKPYFLVGDNDLYDTERVTHWLKPIEANILTDDELLELKKKWAAEAWEEDASSQYGNTYTNGNGDISVFEDDIEREKKEFIKNIQL